jgi:hypothetical protein
MVLTMMPIHLAQTLITSHPPNRVLHADPSTRERPVEGNILWWSLFGARFAARGRAQPLWMLLSNPNVGQIADAANAAGPAIEQFRLFQQRDVGSWPRDTIRHVTDGAGLLVDRDLSLEGMLLFLTAVVPVGLLSTAWTLHALLECVDDDRQFRSLGQQDVQFLAALASGIRHAHGVARGSFQQGDDAGQDARGSTITHAEQEAQHLVSLDTGAAR